MLETFFLICAAIGGTILVLRSALAMLGLGLGEVAHIGDIHDGGHDFNFHHHGGDDGQWHIGKVLSFQAIVAFLAFFGIGGLSALESGSTRGIASAVAFSTGIVAMLLLGWFLGLLRKLQSDGTVRLSDAAGASGRVYLRVPGNGGGVGKVTLVLQGRSVEMEARTTWSRLQAARRSSSARLLDDRTVEVVDPASHVLNRFPCGTEPAALVGSCRHDRTDLSFDTKLTENALDGPPTFLSRDIMPPLAVTILGSDVSWPVIGAVLFAALIFGSLVTFSKCYKRCPSNKVLVKWGVGAGTQTAKTVHGGGELVLPVFQDYDYLSLEPIQIEIPLRGALSFENIRVNVPSVFTVAIGTEPEMHAERGDPHAGPVREEISRPDRRPDLRPAPAGHRPDADRGHQPRPRGVPQEHPGVARAGAAQDRPGPDQCQHHRPDR